MPVLVEFTEDPSEVLFRAGPFLRASPVEHNVILTLLEDRLARPQPGRYWIARLDGEVCGVVFQSPTDFFATLSAIPGTVIAPTAVAVAERAPDLPGVTGAAGDAARFAGAWTEVCSCAAQPFSGQRIYRLGALIPPAGVPGRLRSATGTEAALLARWVEGFGADTGEVTPDPVATVERRLLADQVLVWENGQPVAMAMRTAPVSSVVRVQAVYTPPEFRAHGYASAVVAGVSHRVVEFGSTAILYTDLANPTSNGIYRRLGYSATTEVLRYRFLDAGAG